MSFPGLYGEFRELVAKSVLRTHKNKGQNQKVRHGLNTYIPPICKCVRAICINLHPYPSGRGGLLYCERCDVQQFRVKFIEQKNAKIYHFFLLRSVKGIKFERT